MYPIAASSSLYTSLPSPTLPRRCRRSIFHLNQSPPSQPPAAKDPSHRSRIQVVRGSGLRTPPPDEMTTTYQAPNLDPYDTHHHATLSQYASALAQADRTRVALSDAQAAMSAYNRYPQSKPQLPQPNPRAILASSSATTASQPSSRHPTRPSTPISNPPMSSLSDSGISRRDSAMVMHSLEIPRCISPKGGSLANFAAQLTCLFWFETPQVLQAAEKVDELSPAAVIPRLTDNAVPLDNFKRWVHSILSTTQVTQNVILLALLFIYRLKTTNPTVKGRAGSEYRLLTVALMLGNKFLDDNTYTNKTWAEVSGISVKEIHVMEVEFLSNMRYSLLVSKEEWGSWLVKLARFWAYCERAMLPALSPIDLSSPSHRALTSPLPSPTGNPQWAPAAQPAITPAYAGPRPAWPVSGQGAPALSPLATKRDVRNDFGKRYPEDDPTEPPAKRLSRQPPPATLPSQNLSHMRPAATTTAELLRLPAPNPALGATPPPTQSAPIPAAYGTQGYVSQTAQPGLPLPPLVRAMSTVYPPATSAFAPQLPLLVTSGPTISSGPGAVGYPGGYGTPSKRHSPTNTLAPVSAYASSPLTESFPHMSGVNTPVSHSPSVYLQQRTSPYKPVRHVNTLLIPPPSASLQEYHLSGAVLPPNQMHYQPLGRRNEFRTGIVPEFQSVPYGGAVRQGLSLTPVHPAQARIMGPGMHPSYPN
ncbi:uncharacterized protein E0L32_006460 [Thyridium curvatum]|uniref:Uncharacterized protein n=1 Tax=Thyridium curvatum TaxID=1093900 RepID=A0A507B2T4_9PEZI|nr:uncharacterized protein E0L32_006460 [Thyridium curvatum]TPX13034.1 hypothetical protein E0L32_006460 [Thyridium curvatum]